LCVFGCEGKASQEDSEEQLDRFKCTEGEEKTCWITKDERQ